MFTKSSIFDQNFNLDEIFDFLTISSVFDKIVDFWQKFQFWPNLRLLTKISILTKITIVEKNSKNWNFQFLIKISIFTNILHLGWPNIEIFIENKKYGQKSLVTLVTTILLQKSIKKLTVKFTKCFYPNQNINFYNRRLHIKGHINTML